MAQMPGPGMQRTRAPVGNDIYTVLVAMALAIVLGTLAFVIYRCVDLLGKPFPGFYGS
jgi:hypothetical protein